MSAVLEDLIPENVLRMAQEIGRAAGLPYAGSIDPREAWELFVNGHALLIDVRSPEERKFVGYVPGSLNIAWATGTNLTRNPRFVRELETKAKKTDILLLLCRSGKRSALAAAAATETGFSHAFNIQGGFEGELNDLHQRGSKGGWRFHRLPWMQD